MSTLSHRPATTAAADRRSQTGSRDWIAAHQVASFLALVRFRAAPRWWLPRVPPGPGAGAGAVRSGARTAPPPPTPGPVKPARKAVSPALFHPVVEKPFTVNSTPTGSPGT